MSFSANIIDKRAVLAPRALDKDLKALATVVIQTFGPGKKARVASLGVLSRLASFLLLPTGSCGWHCERRINDGKVLFKDYKAWRDTGGKVLRLNIEIDTK